MRITCFPEARCSALSEGVVDSACMRDQNPQVDTKSCHYPSVHLAPLLSRALRGRHGSLRRIRILPRWF